MCGKVCAPITGHAHSRCNQPLANARGALARLVGLIERRIYHELADHHLDHSLARFRKIRGTG